MFAAARSLLAQLIVSACGSLGVGHVSPHGARLLLKLGVKLDKEAVTALLARRPEAHLATRTGLRLAATEVPVFYDVRVGNHVVKVACATRDDNGVASR